MKEKISDLKPNDRNPRRVTKESLEFLKGTLSEFGDLSGLVYNLNSDSLIGGHQRTKIFPKNAKIKITKRYDKPTKVGTVAIGYVLSGGERFTYREVEWDETKEKAAMLAANKAAGTWDVELVGDFLKELGEEDFDLDLTGFDEDEREDFLTRGSPEFEEGSEADQGKLDEKKKTVCPHCGEEFLVGGRK